MGERIRELRTAQRLSQEQLADRAGANVTYVSSVERGKENPTLDFLMKLADALSVDLVDLFNTSWLALDERDIRKKLKALVDKADLERLRELLALMKTRDL